MAYKSIFGQIVEWNEQRNLLQKINIENEMSFIAEEMIEGVWDIKSEEARKEAKNMVKHLFELGNDTTNRWMPATDEASVDAFADMIVFATGAIAKMGYNPDKVMKEVLKEINSRTGKLVDGKFVKDPDAVRYTADFSNCQF